MKNELNTPRYIMEIAEEITVIADGKSKMELRAKNERRKKAVICKNQEGTSKEMAGR